MFLQFPLYVQGGMLWLKRSWFLQWSTSDRVACCSLPAEHVSALVDHCGAACVPPSCGMSPELPNSQGPPAQCVLWQSKDSDVRMLPRTCDRCVYFLLEWKVLHGLQNASSIRVYDSGLSSQKEMLSPRRGVRHDTPYLRLHSA